MNQFAIAWLACFGALCLEAANVPSATVTTGTLLREMSDLDRLGRWPQPSFRTVQFSSYDRRSTHSEAPGWFSNADGFGREPIPGFLKVLRQPANGQPGLYLLAEVNGPGAIVRGWSAGMDGVLRVILDPIENDEATGLIFTGKGYDFLARRSNHFLKAAGMAVEVGDAFVQEDADYLPIPFARGLRVTWEGTLNDLHFYHLQVRLYEAGTAVRTLDPVKDMKEFEPDLRATAAKLTQPAVDPLPEMTKLETVLQPGTNWSWAPEVKGASAVRELRIQVQSEHQEEALRGCLLRISFDGSQRPQVEAPIGDFFAAGPGISPLSSLPLTVEADGTMSCRFAMPFEKSIRMEVVNFTKATVRLNIWIRLVPWEWDQRSMYFRAKWRVDHDLAGKPAAMDLPYLVAIGRGVFVGCAAMIMNPSGVPTAGGNWWGEGDEKFLVDGETIPSTFGTGSEDYFNYSWSRPDLFDHPYCGQPLDSGPDTSGYISNYRFQIMDAIPFKQSFAGYLELWTHGRVPGMSYARIVYHYARPGAVDDHRGLGPSDLKVDPLPFRQPVAAGGAGGAIFHFPENLDPKASAGLVETIPFRSATQLKILQWRAEKGARLRLMLAVEGDGRKEIHPVLVHRPEGGSVRFQLDGKALLHAQVNEPISLRSASAERVLNVTLDSVELKGGLHELTLECVEPGLVGLDYIWVK